MPIRLSDQSESFANTKLLAIWFIANFDRLSIDALENERIALYFSKEHLEEITIIYYTHFTRSPGVGFGSILHNVELNYIN